MTLTKYFSKNYREGDWYWSHSLAPAVPSVFGWYQGQPDNAGGQQNCGLISPVYYYGWDDVSCAEKHFAICQIVVNK